MGLNSVYLSFSFLFYTHRENKIMVLYLVLFLIGRFKIIHFGGLRYVCMLVSLYVCQAQIGVQESPVKR
jgi:hypothetical protein